MAATPTPPKTSGSFSDLIQEEYAQLKLRENPGQPQPPVARGKGVKRAEKSAEKGSNLNVCERGKGVKP